MKSISPTNSIFNWLTSNTNYPIQRLPEKIELALCFSTLATAQNYEPESIIGRINRKQNAVESSQRALAQNRKHAHFKCDNSAKV